MTPTLAQMNADPYYKAEVTPQNLAALGAKVKAHYKLAAGTIGYRGDVHHLKGYHRSRAFCLHSPYSTNRTYSVTETPGNRTGGRDYWVCAIDLTLPHDLLLKVCGYLDKAVRSGRLEKVTEWYGNLNGDTRVDGYDNIRNRVATSDSSHLWHLHISLDRGKANDVHDDLYGVLTGRALTPAPVPPVTPGPPPAPAPVPVQPPAPAPAPQPPVTPPAPSSPTATVADVRNAVQEALSRVAHALEAGVALKPGDPDTLAGYAARVAAIIRDSHPA